jgi:(p)ppGpp synthase/HD superfamily hydrolase
MSDLLHFNIIEARAFAEAAHEGQTRKGSGEPYFMHVARVATTIRDLHMPVDAVCAAYLHDVLEDTETTFEELELRFGTDTAMLVLELTDVFTPEEYPSLNRAARKKLEAERYATISPIAKAIKFADIMDNTHNIMEHLPDFARVYLKEKEYAMHCLLGGEFK